MSDAHDRKQPAAEGAHEASPAPGYDGKAEVSAAEGASEPGVCMPCHGTGKVISSLGGDARKVTCPWCRGGGQRLPDADAQEWRQEQATVGSLKG